MKDKAGESVEHDAAGMTVSASKPGIAVTSMSAILLLSIVSAIIKTGMSLSTTSLVEAAKGLHLSAFMYSASASATSLAMAATAMAAGVAADRLGRHRVLMWSFVIAGGANLAICLFPTGPVYLGGLIFAGVGYSIMVTSSFAYIHAVAPGRSLGWGLGLFSLFSTLMCAVTSVLGSMLAFADWRWLFLVVPLMSACCLILAPRLLPPMPREGSGPFDFWGLALLGVAMVAITTGVSMVTAKPAERMGWLVILVSIALFCVWVLVELRGRTPSFPIRLFKSPFFLNAVIAGLGCAVAGSSMSLGVNDAVQVIAKGSPLDATLAMEVSFLAGGFSAVVVGRMLSNGATERSMMAGTPLVAAAGFACLALLRQGSSAWMLVLGIVLAGAGISAVLTAQGQVIIKAAQGGAFGAVTSTKATIGRLGSALGAVLTVLVVKVVMGGEAFAALQNKGMTQADVQSAIASAERSQGAGIQNVAQAYPQAVSQALSMFGSALQTLMLFGAIVMVATSVASWLLLRDRRATSVGV